MKEPIYIASHLKNDEDENGNIINIYDTPFPVFAYLNAMNGDFRIEEFGDEAERKCRTMLNKIKWFGKIKEGDIAYLYGASPKGESVHGENANYHVVSVLPQGVKMLVYFERNTEVIENA